MNSNCESKEKHILVVNALISSMRSHVQLLWRANLKGQNEHLVQSM